MGYVEDLRAIVGHRPLILVGSVVVVQDELGRILLQARRVPPNKWGLPGGLMELRETTEDTARRELFEETGLVAGDLDLITVSSGPGNLCKAENGDEFYVVTLAYVAHSVSGILSIDPSESRELRYFATSDLPSEIVKSHRQILDKWLNSR